MDWTNEKLEELFAEMQKKAMTDTGFRKKLLEDSDAALEELAGQKLPEGLKIKIIENDPAYTATFVLPDLVSEEMTPEDMDAAAGGFGILLVASACRPNICDDVGPATVCRGNVCAIQSKSTD